MSKIFYLIKLDTVFCLLCLIVFAAAESLFCPTQKNFLPLDWIIWYLRVLISLAICCKIRNSHQFFVTQEFKFIKQFEKSYRYREIIIKRKKCFQICVPSSLHMQLILNLQISEKEERNNHVIQRCSRLTILLGR